jgi:hypothetical protein
VLTGNPESLMSDLERIVFKKVRQLDDTVACLINDPSALGLPVVSRQLQPVVVAAGGFAMSPVTANAITQYCLDERKLSHALVRPLAVITPDEVEMLEGLVESRSISLAEVLSAWKCSSLAPMSLRNFLLSRYGSEVLVYRPMRMRPRFDRFTEDVLGRLQLRER